MRARRPAGRAKQEIDYGPAGKGYVFGAFRPATGAAFTAPTRAAAPANWVDFLEQVEAWLPQDVERVYAILDNLSSHRATDVLLFSLAHPRWEFVFQPKYAAYLNLIEPWWKVLRSLALKGRRFATWEEVTETVPDRPLHIKSRRAVSFDQADRASLWQNASRQMLVHSGCGQVIAVFVGGARDLAHPCRVPGGEAAVGQIASELSQSGAAKRNDCCRQA